jgi:2-oxoacid:acceptor oxidoreductase delta subunit (pyruvate/2-ketoisovalerate family)
MPEVPVRILPWKVPLRLEEHPAWPHTASGRLIEGHAQWRLQRPVFDEGRCTRCLQCYLMCPDAAILLHEGVPSVDLRLCKGCGVCVKECELGAFRMAPEHP